MNKPYSEFMKTLVTIGSLMTPIIVALLGFLLLRKVESIKAEVTKHSDFTSLWAGAFWSACQEFMQFTERYMAILNQLQLMSEPNGDLGTKYQLECNELNVKLSELELRIRRFVIFAQKSADRVKTSASKILSILSSILNTRKGSLDDLFSEVENFNKAARRAHAEMLNIKDTGKMTSDEL